MLYGCFCVFFSCLGFFVFFGLVGSFGRCNAVVQQALIRQLNEQVISLSKLENKTGDTNKHWDTPFQSRHTIVLS
jgi:hypothetical protein